MAISLASLRSSTSLSPPRLLLYGVAGVGKTKLAADAPRPVMLQTEDGLGRIEATTFGLLRSFDEIMEAFGRALFRAARLRNAGGGQPRLAGTADLAAHGAHAQPARTSSPSATARAISPRSIPGAASSTA
jgi:hypothetical protein